MLLDTSNHQKMKTEINHSSQYRADAGQQYIPLAQEQRTHVDTNAAAYYLNRRPQTLRGWHCHGAFPTDGLRPLVLNGRLAWCVAAIKSAMGGTK